jgi:hypothetical protein
MQNQELSLKEREAALQRLQSDAEYARNEADANLRSQKDESAALSRKLEALQEARVRSAKELDERETALQEQVRVHLLCCAQLS